MTIIEIRPFRNGWKCFEAPGVDPSDVGITRANGKLNACTIWRYFVRATLMKVLALLLTAAALLGCAADSHFIAYQGAQQNWPTAPGSMVETKFAVPVYYGLPPRKYTVMGELTAEEEGRWRWSDPESDAMEDVAKEAKKIGADAIIVTGRETGVGGYISSGTATVSGNTAYGRGITRSIKTAQARVVAIKFR